MVPDFRKDSTVLLPVVISGENVQIIKQLNTWELWPMGTVAHGNRGPWELWPMGTHFVRKLISRCIFIRSPEVVMWILLL